VLILATLVVTAFFTAFFIADVRTAGVRIGVRKGVAGAGKLFARYSHLFRMRIMR
jgi:hypothetical protein